MTRKDCFCLHDYRRVLSLINHFRIKVHSPSVYYAGTTGDFLSNFSSYSFHLAHGIGHLDWTRNSAMNRCTTTGTRVRVVKTFFKNAGHVARKSLSRGTYMSKTQNAFGLLAFLSITVDEGVVFNGYLSTRIPIPLALFGLRSMSSAHDS